MKILKDRHPREPLISVEEQQANFLDDAFGEGVTIEYHLNEGDKEYKADLAKIASKTTGVKAKNLLARKLEYKE